MGWTPEFTADAAKTLSFLSADPSQLARAKAVKKVLGWLEVNPRHQGLNTHEFKGTDCPHGGKLFEAYAQNNTAGAYPIFWCYAPAPAQRTIVIVAITPHP